MARPTTWRRSFNVGPVPGFRADGIASRDLLTIQPGETLGGTWWQYQFSVISAPNATTTVPMDSTVTNIGLIVQPAGEPDVFPLSNPGAEWLWLEKVAWSHTFVSTTGEFVNTSISGVQQQKAQAMRKNDTVDNMTLKVAYETFAGEAAAPEIEYAFAVSVQALIILP